ncbi:MAG TPA: transglycosylase SLT domain-containing protein [Saprospiraceae bacterium]|nr:transglycosylase SLT domain-containing protein [Saprospiraceae bacterium]HMU02929.1 transglycosylase SLT domain-containing protein [Saprospiraceae bacterium]
MTTRILVLVCVWTLLVPGLIIAKSPSNAEIIKRIQNLNTNIDVRVTEEVTEQITALVEVRRKESETILGRTSLYFPMIENAIREKNLPDELKYVAVIESGLIPYTESHKGAAGIWQFMKGTAELYGLRIDKHIDERKDLMKSTDKALDYLKLLYEIYGNWTLALTAYNCGSGNLNKAIKKANGSTNYWEIQKYLPKETQKYIPKFIAVSYLMNYYYAHDLQPIEPSDDLKYAASVRVFDKVDFKKIVKEFEIDIELVKVLNPMYRKGYIPASESGEYYLTLPKQKMMVYMDKYDSQDFKLANTYSQFQQMGKNSNFNLTTDNQALEKLDALPVKSYAIRDNMKSRKVVQLLAQDLTIINQTPVMHQLRRKESLADLAVTYNIPLGELLAINNIDEKKGVNPGSFIQVSRP